MTGLKLIVGGAANKRDEDIVEEVVKRLGSTQLAANYFAGIAAQRRELHDVATGRKAASRLTAIPTWKSRA